jgi:hypothetical protein
MTILRTEMAWGISIDIFRVDVGAYHQHSLDNSKVTPDACDMQRGSKIPGPCVDLTSVLNEQLNEVYVTFVTSHM